MSTFVDGSETTMKQSTKAVATVKVSVPNIAKAKAQALWTAAKETAVEAFGLGRSSRLAVGEVIANAEANHLAYAAATAVSKRNVDDMAKADTSQAIADAIANVYGVDASPTRQECFNMKRHYQVLDIMSRRGIGTQAQRDTFSEGAARSIPKAMKEANAETILAKAAKAANGKRITGALIDAAKPAKKEGKKAPSKKNATPKVQPSDVVTFLANATKNGTEGTVSDDMKAELSAAWSTYWDSI